MDSGEKPKKLRGLATLTKEERVRIARLGGMVTGSKKDHMSRIGRLGGIKTSSDRAHMARIGSNGGVKNKGKKRKLDDEGDAWDGA